MSSKVIIRSLVPICKESITILEAHFDQNKAQDVVFREMLYQSTDHYSRIKPRNGS
jgi:hypothetical protein